MKKYIISVISFAAAFFAVQYGIDYYREYSTVNSVNATIETIREDARKNNPGEPEVLAVQQAASKKIEEHINSNGSQKARLQTAAGAFLGFYLVNFRQRAEYCQNLGIDITPFTSAFEESHKNEYAVAVKVMLAARLNIDKIFSMLKPQFITVIEQDMEYIASENGVTLAEACQLISDKSPVLIPDMHISVMQPAVYKALMSGA